MTGMVVIQENAPNTVFFYISHTPTFGLTVEVFDRHRSSTSVQRLSLYVANIMLPQKIFTLYLLCYRSITATSFVPGMEAQSISIRGPSDPHVGDSPISLPAQSRSSLQPRHVPTYLLRCFGARNKKNHCLMNCQCRNNSLGQVSCGFSTSKSTKRVRNYFAMLRATCPLSCKCDRWMDLHSQSSLSGPGLLPGIPYSQSPASHSTFEQPRFYLGALMQRAPIQIEESPPVGETRIHNPPVEHRSISASTTKSLEPRSLSRYRLNCGP